MKKSFAACFTVLLLSSCAGQNNYPSDAAHDTTKALKDLFIPASSSSNNSEIAYQRMHEWKTAGIPYSEYQLFKGQNLTASQYQLLHGKEISNPQILSWLSAYNNNILMVWANNLYPKIKMPEEIPEKAQRFGLLKENFQKNTIEDGYLIVLRDFMNAEASGVSSKSISTIAQNEPSLLSNPEKMIEIARIIQSGKTLPAAKKIYEKNIQDRNKHEMEEMRKALLKQCQSFLAYTRSSSDNGILSFYHSNLPESFLGVYESSVEGLMHQMEMSCPNHSSLKLLMLQGLPKSTALYQKIKSQMR